MWRQCFLSPSLRYCCLRVGWYYNPHSGLQRGKGIINSSSKLPLKRDITKTSLLNSAIIKQLQFFSVLKSLDVSLMRLMGMIKSQWGCWISCPINQFGTTGDSWSCVQQFISITHEIYKVFDCKPSLEVQGVFLDVSKAYNKVWCDKHYTNLDITA